MDPDDMLLVVDGVIVACLIQLLGTMQRLGGSQKALILDTTYQASPKETTPEPCGVKHNL